MIRLVRFAIPVLTIFCVCAACSAQGREARSMSGHVYYSDTRQAAYNVLVELHSQEGSVLSPASTNESGSFTFVNLLAALYTVTVSQQGYQPLSQQVDLSYASENGIMLNLVPIAKKDSGTAKGTVAVSAHILSMPQSAQDGYNDGRQKLFTEKNPKESVKLFEKAVAGAPNFYEAWEQLCVAQLSLGNSAEAEKAARKSIETSGDKYALADFDEGFLLMDRLQFSDGEKYVRHGLELAPDSWVGHFELGRALFSQGHVKDALASAEKSKSLNPRNPNVYRLLANIHMRQRDTEALRGDLDEYIRLDPASPAGQRAQQMLASLPKAQTR